eukprot:364938-Chlamydomonas_euryale.AAC.27
MILSPEFSCTATLLSDEEASPPRDTDAAPSACAVCGDAAEHLKRPPPRVGWEIGRTGHAGSAHGT